MTGATLRDLGLAQVANSHPEFVTLARKTMDALIRLNGSTTIDQVRDLLADAGIYPDSNHAWGAVPAPAEYVCIGHRQSARPSNRARIVRIWAHEIPKLDMEPPQKAERQEYYFSPRQGAKEGPYRAQY